MRRLAAFFCIAAFLGGCGRHKHPDYSRIPDKNTVADGGTLIEGTGGEAIKLNPILYDDASSGDICDLLFMGLLRYNSKLVLEGCLAENWKVTDSGKTITFKLRKNLKWQDGQPITSEDAAFTYHLIMDPKVASPRESDFEAVRSVETPDPLTFVVHYKTPFAPALESWGIGLLPEHVLRDDKNINQSPFNRNPVGDGPYQFVRWEDKQFIQLAANPLYYEGMPHIRRYVVRFIPEPATELLELKSGEVDQCILSPDQFASETGDAQFTQVAEKHRTQGYDAYEYMGFNLKKAPFNDPRVRMALSHAIDRKALIEGVLQGYGQPCSGPYSPLMPAYNPAVQPVSYDLAESARLLDQAGWRLGKSGLREKDGKLLRFRLITNQGNDARKKIVLILQQQFAKLGVEADVQTYEWSTFLNNYINPRDFDAFVLGWQLSLDPDIYAIWHSSQTGPAQLNIVSYHNLQVDHLLQEGRKTFDPQKRMSIYRKVHALIAKDQPYAFLYCPDGLSALSRKVQGVEVLPTGYSWSWPEHWYIPTSLQP